MRVRDVAQNAPAQPRESSHNHGRPSDRRLAPGNQTAQPHTPSSQGAQQKSPHHGHRTWLPCVPDSKIVSRAMGRALPALVYVSRTLAHATQRGVGIQAYSMCLATDRSDLAVALGCWPESDRPTCYDDLGRSRCRVCRIYHNVQSQDWMQGMLRRRHNRPRMGAAHNLKVVTLPYRPHVRMHCSTTGKGRSRFPSKFAAISIAERSLIGAWRPFEEGN